MATSPRRMTMASIDLLGRASDSGVDVEYLCRVPAQKNIDENEAGAATGAGELRYADFLLQCDGTLRRKSPWPPSSTGVIRSFARGASPKKLLDLMASKMDGPRCSNQPKKSGTKASWRHPRAPPNYNLKIKPPTQKRPPLDRGSTARTLRFVSIHSSNKESRESTKRRSTSSTNSDGMRLVLPATVPLERQLAYSDILSTVLLGRRKKKRKKLPIQRCQLACSCLSAVEAPVDVNLMPTIVTPPKRIPDPEIEVEAVEISCTKESSKQPPINIHTWCREVADMLSEETSVSTATVIELWGLFCNYSVTNGEILIQLHSADEDLEISMTRFHLIILNFIRDNFSSARDIPREIFTLDEHEGSMVGFRDFLTWFAKHGFNESVVSPERDRDIRRLANKCNMPVQDLDYILETFSTIKNDIAFPVFRQTLLRLLKLPDSAEDLEGRICCFWNHFELTAKGVTVIHFLKWFFVYFRDPHAESLIREFYHSIRRPICNDTQENFASIE